MRARISWHRDVETRHPHGPLSPDADRLAPLGFPPPWPTRPWIYANVIASRNGIVTWKRAGARDDPVRAIAGGDFTRPGRLADLQLMRHLRACGDAVSVGAQTLRDHPDFIGTPEDIGDGLGEALSRFRASQGRRRLPLQVVYSGSGRLDLDAPIFTTPDVTVIIVTTDPGACLLRSRGSEERSITVLVAGQEKIEPTGLVRSHERLADEFGVRYLDCEGGAMTLESLHAAGILDEVFVTVTDVHIEPSEHAGVKGIVSFGAEAGRLIAEGRADSDGGYLFRRWRVNER